ncbi:enoyl-CoA hydratase [Desulfococcus sp.]|uniref:enoyl-CoA hydratase n=1 Tax=Desulfococcus sp. TaxID=2025834 RepID=UPI00359391AC
MALVLFEEKNALGWLTLNQPESRNALSLEMIGAIQAHLNHIKTRSDLKVIIIRGNGPVFCAGHNLKEFSIATPDVGHIRRIFLQCSEMMLSLQQMPQPVIAQVHGIATAAGCQLVAACDLAVAENGARFATPGVRIGLFCTTPMVPLVRVIGRRRAMEMLLSGRMISAAEAEAYGLVNRVVPPERLAEETETWACELSQFSGFTLGFGKRAFYAQVDLAETDAYRHAAESMVVNSLDGDAREGISAFLEKRSPVWAQGRDR